MLKTKARQLILAAAVLGLLVFLNSFGAFKPVEAIVGRILNPLLAGVYRISSLINHEYFKQAEKTDLREKVSRLEAEVSELTVKNVELNLLEAENKTLREHLDFLTAKKFNYLMANVISRGDISDVSERTETVMIDKGFNDGVYSGLPVLSGQGVIIGKITEIKSGISKVILTNSHKCKLAATILNQQKTSGIAEGELGLTIKMNFIPQTEEIKPGDIIITSGLEKSIPIGLVIGKVAEVRKENNDLWQTAAIEPMANPEGITVVAVLLP